LVLPGVVDDCDGLVVLPGVVDGLLTGVVVGLLPGVVVGLDGLVTEPFVVCNGSVVGACVVTTLLT